jgi:hypothetical protein
MLLNHPEIRHTCEQSDSLTSYAYTQHDGRTYSSQELVDGKINAKITTKFLKSESGDGWVVRVRGEVIDPSKPSNNVSSFHFNSCYMIRSALTFDFDLTERKEVQLTTLFPSCLFRRLFSGKISRTSLIYHFGLEGLGELRLYSEVDEEVSWALLSLPQEQSTEGLCERFRYLRDVEIGG